MSQIVMVMPAATVVVVTFAVRVVMTVMIMVVTFVVPGVLVGRCRHGNFDVK